MKKFGFIILLLLAGNLISVAQNAEMDSLINAEKNYLPEDSIHLKLLGRIMNSFYYTDPYKYISYCNKTLALAKKLGRKELFAGLNRTLVTHYSEIGEFDIALEKSNIALELYKKINDSIGIADVYGDLGTVYLQKSNLAAAEKYMKQAVHMFESLSQGKRVARTNYNLGIVYEKKADYRKAQEYILKAAKYFEENNLRKELATPYHELGILFFRTGDYSKAREYYLKSISISESFGDVRNAATAKMNLAICYSKETQIDMALKNYFEALATFEKFNYPSRYSIYTNMATLLNRMSDSTYNRLQESGFFENLGSKASNQYELAEYLLLKSVSNEKNIGSFGLRVENYITLGETYGKLKDYELAIRCAQKGIRLADSVQEPNLMRDAFKTMSMIYEAMGKYDSAYYYYKEFISQRDSIDNKDVRDQLARKDAEYEYRIKENDILRQKELSDISAANANTLLQHQLLLALTREQELQLKDKALEIGSKEKEMQHLAYLKKMAELDVVKLEKQEREKQLSLTKQDFTVQELKLGKRELERNLLIVGVALSLLSIFLIFRNYRNQRKSNLKQKELNSKIRWVNEELNLKNNKLAETLDDLKQTQAQLVETEKQKETEILRRRISQDIHDDISSGLTRIAWLSELAREKAKNGKPSDAESALEKIIASSRETVDRLGEIIWAINPDRDNLEGFFAYLRSYIVKFFEDTKFDVKLDFPEKRSDMKFNPDLKRTLFLVVKEALHNIAKHSEAKKISVAFRCPDHRYSITITDDGKGFDLAVMALKGNGLKNMQKRMESVGGTIEIESKPQQGTVVSLEGEVYN